jgi:hypothetical protein
MKRNIAKTRREEMAKMWWFQIADHFLGALAGACCERGRLFIRFWVFQHSF